MSISAANPVRPVNKEGRAKRWYLRRILTKPVLRDIKESAPKFPARAKDLVCVFICSNQNISAQVIDDVTGVTLVSASTLEAGFEGNGSNKEAAKKVGETIAKRAIEKGITEIVFDRGGYIYHGRVLELAEGAREGGLKF